LARAFLGTPPSAWELGALRNSLMHPLTEESRMSEPRLGGVSGSRRCGIVRIPPNGAVRAWATRGTWGVGLSGPKGRGLGD